ncbi:hypothetical protein FIBSPDRAFT_939804 [Athelia psychrophila]|uniref:Mid2 domain-containing protein n=1 Tax=Athelia psychrophila TaxID=1759441 RepID=A0A167X5I1_9AGAM|nr:hypothetical protein FIBSPDRAFT_939804 [Fibularhizoctonia sp. CBS 109695]
MISSISNPTTNLNLASLACIALAHAGLAHAKGGGGGHSTSHPNTTPSTSKTTTSSHGKTIIIIHSTSHPDVCYNDQNVVVKCPAASKKQTAIIVGVVVGVVVLAIIVIVLWSYRTRVQARFARMRGVKSTSRGIGTGIHDDEAQLQPKDTAYIPVSADDEHEKDGKHDYDEKDGCESVSLSEPPVYHQEEHFHTMPHPHFDDMKQ